MVVWLERISSIRDFRDCDVLWLPYGIPPQGLLAVSGVLGIVALAQRKQIEANS